MPTLEENVSLAKLSSYNIGGPARYFFEASTKKDLLEIFKEWNGKFFVLGGGTNLLISDAGFDGLVLKPKFNFLERDGTDVYVGAAVLMSDLLNFTIKENLSGLEWAGGLPGTLGGAIRGNAGCFGGEMKDSIRRVFGFDKTTLKDTERENVECRFAYRSSIFKERQGDEIVVAATLALQKGESEKINASINEKINYRKERHPMEYPNIGSIFKNVPVASFPASELHRVAQVIKNDPFPVIPAAYLISEAGIKGTRHGGAMISPKHPNFIVNVGDARASDVHALIDLVKHAIKKEFNVELQEEIQAV
ncbi:MAG: UDP-N-acetylmuramate dehydrogenase [Patescibacteria group bacterium]